MGPNGHRGSDRMKVATQARPWCSSTAAMAYRERHLLSFMNVPALGLSSASMSQKLDHN